MTVIIYYHDLMGVCNKLIAAYAQMLFQIYPFFPSFQILIQPYEPMTLGFVLCPCVCVVLFKFHVRLTFAIWWYVSFKKE